MTLFRAYWIGFVETRVTKSPVPALVTFHATPETVSSTPILVIATLFFLDSNNLVYHGKDHKIFASSFVTHEYIR